MKSRFPIVFLVSSAFLVLFVTNAFAITSNRLYTVSGSSDGLRLGHSTTTGDFNGDGYADVIAGAPGSEPYGPHGYVIVLFGGVTADSVVDLKLVAPLAGSSGLFGTSVAATDFTGDGYDDILVGAVAHNRVFVFHGGPAADSIPDQVIIQPLRFNERFGDELERAGDVNGDGYQDVIVGAPYSGVHWVRQGRAYVYFGGPLADLAPDLTFEEGNESFLLVGYSVAGGDLNNDGFSDLIVGSGSGRVYIYLGGAAPDTVSDLTIDGRMLGSGDYPSLGQAVTYVRDMQADGYGDVVVGEPSGSSNRALIFSGAAMLDATPELAYEEPDDFKRFGADLAFAGDVNRDGRGDLLVGAPGAGRLNNLPGRGVLFLGGAPADSMPDFTWHGDLADDWFGYSMAAGDVNRDLIPEVVIGAPSHNDGSNVTGRLYVFGLGSVTGVLPELGSGSVSFAAWPTPAAGVVHLGFNLNTTEKVDVSVYDAAGRRVAHPIADEWLSEGRNTRRWQPAGIPRGLLFVRARIGLEESVRRVVWLGSSK